MGGKITVLKCVCLFLAHTETTSLLGDIFPLTGWNVDYQPLICAVKGSSVVIPCSFQYPPAKKIKFVMWDHENYDMLGPFVYDSRSADTSSKYQYIGDKHHNCSLRVNQVEHKDAGTYRFRFESNSRAGKWTGQGGSILKIVDAIAVVKRTNGDTVKEGDSVTLSCSWCDGGVPSSAFVWLKNGEPFSEGPSLSFKDISFANSGNYTCSLKAHEGSTSGVQHVNVERELKVSWLNAHTTSPPVCLLVFIVHALLDTPVQSIAYVLYCSPVQYQHLNAKTYNDIIVLVTNGVTW
uniref:B-cell receptor CD22 n=1 Tax=Scophthalmus maximus TaxID=52904 RepID=A0A8D3C441_SCOMX